jgi:hypothetical protein
MHLVPTTGRMAGRSAHFAWVNPNHEGLQAGKYFTTTIWEFELKCAKCDNKMFVRTDPENTTYKCEKGCRAAVQGWEEDEDTLKQPDAKEKRRIESDPFYKLEYSAADDGSGRRKDEVKAKEMKPVIANLRELVDVRSRDDALLNRALRRGFRGEKKILKKRERDDAEERERLNYGIPILPASSEDAALAKRQQFGKAMGGVDEDARYEEARRNRRKEIMRASLFGESGASSSIGSGSSTGGSIGSSSSTSRILAPGSRAAKKVVLGVLGLGASGKKVGAGLTISTQPASVNASGQQFQGLGGESVLDSLGSMYGDDSDD